MANPRVVVLADDLIWSTKLVNALRAAGADGVPARNVDAIARYAAAGAAYAIVDLTARAYDGVAAVAAARAAGQRVLAVGQHDDLPLRRAALAAGAERVFAYSKLAADGPGTLSRWLAGGAATLADDDGSEASPEAQS